MRTHTKILVYAAVASTLLFACNDNGTNSTEQNSISSSSNAGSSSSLEIIEIPAMDSRVVSYQITHYRWGEYGVALGDYPGLTADEDILKAGFPHIFNDGQAESGCSYFALYWRGSGDSPPINYLVLSQDMVLYSIGCTWKDPPRIGNTGLGIYEAMLICDDDAGTIRERIDFDSVRVYRDPDWECESNWECGSGACVPNREEPYF